MLATRPVPSPPARGATILLCGIRYTSFPWGQLSRVGIVDSTALLTLDYNLRLFPTLDCHRWTVELCPDTSTITARIHRATTRTARRDQPRRSRRTSTSSSKRPTPAARRTRRRELGASRPVVIVFVDVQLIVLRLVLLSSSSRYMLVFIVTLLPVAVLICFWLL